MNTWGEQHFNCLLKEMQTSPNQTDMSRGKGNVPVSPGSWKLLQCDGRIWQSWEVGFSSVASLVFFPQNGGLLPWCKSRIIPIAQFSDSRLMLPPLVQAGLMLSSSFSPRYSLCKWETLFLCGISAHLSGIVVQYFSVSGWPRGDENKRRSNCSF